MDSKLITQSCQLSVKESTWDLCLPLDHSEMLVTATPWFQIQRGSQKISRDSEGENGFEVWPQNSPHGTQPSMWARKKQIVCSYMANRTLFLGLFPSNFSNSSVTCAPGWYSSSAISVIIQLFKAAHQFKHSPSLSWLKLAMAWHL